MSAHVVLVPSTPALLPAYAGIEDPVADLRAACLEAVRALVSDHPDRLRVVAAPPRGDNVSRGVGEAAGLRVARHLLAEAGFAGDVTDDADGVLVVANGSATRSEKAPGHLDDRAHPFDEAIGAALRAGDGPALRDLDATLAEDLWCFDVAAWRILGDVVDGTRGRIMYEDDAYGVKYWVGEWRCES